LKIKQIYLVDFLKILKINKIQNISKAIGFSRTPLSIKKLFIPYDERCQSSISTSSILSSSFI
jgi:hypothetical protein